MFVRQIVFHRGIFSFKLFGSAWAQSAKPPTLADLAKYTGADRGRLLYDGAKKEGKFLWYTSLIANKEIAKIFESKYPGVTVETYRASGTQLATQGLGRGAVEAISRRCNRNFASRIDGIARQPTAFALHFAPSVRIPRRRQTKGLPRLGLLDD